MSDSAPRLRSDLPYARIAVVLSGGGALGAYEAGVLRVLERVGLRPAVMAGVSVGAINALIWLAHEYRAQAVVDTWTSLRPAGIGLRWTTLAVRALGMLLLAISILEVVLSLIGSPELGVWRWIRGTAGGAVLSSVVLDVIAWTIVGIVGALLASLSRRVEDLLARLGQVIDAPRWHRWLGRFVLLMTAVHVVTWAAGFPWPHRFSATTLLALGAIWLFNRPGRTVDGMRGLLLRMLPETGGRGAWGSSARKRLIERVMARGRPRNVITGKTRLVISACALDTGTMTYFINWPDPSPAFLRRAREALGEVKVIRRPREAVRAVVASSALPLVYEPVEIDGREYVDGAVFANQPLRVLVPEEADAVLVVLLSPSDRLESPRKDANLMDLGARLIEMANWRDLQAELRALPPSWSREPLEGVPARVCVVEPAESLPGGVLGFDPRNAVELVARGERDAYEALRKAGWLYRTASASDERPAVAPGYPGGGSDPGPSGPDA